MKKQDKQKLLAGILLVVAVLAIFFIRGGFNSPAPAASTVENVTEAAQTEKIPEASKTDSPASTARETVAPASTSPSTEAPETKAPETSAPAPSAPATEAPKAIDEHGTYTSKEDVALYIRTYSRLPENFITKNEAEKLGWSGGSLEPYAPGKCIGGDRFGNYEGLLPKKSGRTYTECDVDTLGAKAAARSA